MRNMLAAFLSAQTIKRTTIVALPVLISLMGSVGVVKGIHWLTEKPIHAADSGQEEAPPVEAESPNANPAGRAPASVGQRQMGRPMGDDSYNAAPQREEPQASSEILSTPSSVESSSTVSIGNFQPDMNRTPAANPPEAQAKAAAAKSDNAALPFGPTGSGSGTTDSTPSVGSSAGISAGAISTTTPAATIVAAGVGASVSAGGIPLTATASGHKVSVTVGSNVSLATTTTPTGHTVRFNIQGMATD